MSVIIGWDIGGVHLKAARAENGCITRAAQYAAPLRAGPERLLEAFAQAREEMGPADRHAVTMTGELADTFASREEGVEQLSSLAARELGSIAIYAGPFGFVGRDEARQHYERIASANWYASGALIAKHRKTALLIDLGSTTTDIVPIADGKVAARGYTDAQRLAASELVYTGLVRGFVMATADRAPLRGLWMPLINENFATMADVHRILGSLPADVDLMATADGREKTIAASSARLARMVGSDKSDGSEVAWTLLAKWFAEAQVRTIADAVMVAMSACTAISAAPIVAAGIGLAIIAEIARRLGSACVGFDEFLDVTPEARTAVSHCAPAAALAVLAS